MVEHNAIKITFWLFALGLISLRFQPSKIELLWKIRSWPWIQIQNAPLSFFKWRTFKSIFVIPHAASKTFIQLTGHVWLWETPENCFFSVLFVMSRSVSFLTIVCLVADSFIQSRDETYYNKVFRNRDCIPLTGACWILGFAVAISPFSSSRNEFNLLSAQILSCDLR